MEAEELIFKYDRVRIVDGRLEVRRFKKRSLLEILRNYFIIRGVWTLFIMAAVFVLLGFLFAVLSGYSRTALNTMIPVSFCMMIMMYYKHYCKNVDIQIKNIRIADFDERKKILKFEFEIEKRSRKVMKMRNIETPEAADECRLLIDRLNAAGCGIFIEDADVKAFGSIGRKGFFRLYFFLGLAASLISLALLLFVLANTLPNSGVKLIFLITLLCFAGTAICLFKYKNADK